MEGAFKSAVLHKELPASSRLAKIMWTSPPVGWWKLNTDGVFSNVSLQASSRGLIKYNRGDWLVGFSARFDGISALDAEFHTVLKRLVLAWNQGCRKVILEVDSLQV